MLRNSLYRPWFVGESSWGFEILEGDFAEVVVQIEKLDFASDNTSNMDIQYHVIKKPESLSESDTKGDLFKVVFETIINDILREALDTFKDEQDRNNNSAEPSSQR